MFEQEATEETEHPALRQIVDTNDARLSVISAASCSIRLLDETHPFSIVVSKEGLSA